MHGKRVKKIMNSLVTVIVPGYNIEKYVQRCMESICNQTYKNLEILLIDDGSTDETGVIFDAYQGKDSRIKVVHKDNGGVSSARNLGLDIFTGKYVMFVDGDDWIEENTIATLVSVAEESHSDVVLFEYYVDYENGESIKYCHPQYEGRISMEQAINLSITPVNRFSVTKMYARKLLESVRFDETIHLGEDTLLACEAMSKGKNAFFVAVPFYHYIQSVGSATRNKHFNQRMLTGEKAYKKLIELCSEKYPNLVDVAISNYLEITMSIIMDMFKDSDSNKEYMKEYQKRIREYWGKIIFNEKCPMATKIKATLCSISPKFMYKVRKHK